MSSRITKAEAELADRYAAAMSRRFAGLRVTIRHSKTDQEAAGAVVAVPEGRTLRPLRALPGRPLPIFWSSS